MRGLALIVMLHASTVFFGQYAAAQSDSEIASEPSNQDELGSKIEDFPINILKDGYSPHLCSATDPKCPPPSEPEPEPKPEPELLQPQK